MEWPLKGVQFVNRDIVHSFYIKHFECIAEKPWQVMTYMAAMDDSLAKTCPKLDDQSITSAGQQADNQRATKDYIRNWPAGNTAGVRIGLESESIFRDAGETDAKILYDNAPGKCESAVTKTILANMRVYAQSPPH
jgi:hypothetical protein